jgi:hypothetical protein
MTSNVVEEEFSNMFYSFLISAQQRIDIFRFSKK